MPPQHHKLYRSTMECTVETTVLGAGAEGVTTSCSGGDTTRPRHITYVQVSSKSDQRWLKKNCQDYDGMQDRGARKQDILAENTCTKPTITHCSKRPLKWSVITVIISDKDINESTTYQTSFQGKNVAVLLWCRKLTRTGLPGGHSDFGQCHAKPLAV